MKFYLVNRNSIEVIVDSNLYSSKVLFKCLYWYGDNFICDVYQKGEDWAVTVALKEGDFSEDAIQNFISKFKQDLIDFKTREIITEETKNVRDILLVKAFAYNDEFDGAPPGEIEDPVGFDPKMF